MNAGRNKEKSGGGGGEEESGKCALSLSLSLSLCSSRKASNKLPMSKRETDLDRERRFFFTQ